MRCSERCRAHGSFADTSPTDLARVLSMRPVVGGACEILPEVYFDVLKKKPLSPFVFVTFVRYESAV